MMGRPSWLLTAAMLGTLVVPVASAVSPAAPVGAAASATTFCGSPAPTQTPTEEALESYAATDPVRLVDTRDGTGGLSAPIGKGCTLQLDLTGSPVPDDADAIGISLTAVSPRRGFFTVYPCATGRPVTSNLNSRDGMATSNFVVARLDDARRICIFSNQGSDLIVDLAGWWSDGPNRFNSIAPVRAYDSRERLPIRLPANAIQNVPIGGPFVPADATAAVINLTMTDSTKQGFIVAFPCGSAAPMASSLNVRAGENRAVAAIVGLGLSGEAAGQVCVQSNVDTHFVIDVTGYYAPAPRFGPAASLQPMVGSRLVDTRDGTGRWNTPFPGGETRTFDPVAGLPSANEASAVLLNVVATNGVRRGNVRVFPCNGSDVPESSSLNFGEEVSATNLVSVQLSTDREVCIYTSAETDIVVDLFGVMAAPDGSLAEQLSFGNTTVYPPFTPDGRDYAIQCTSSEANALPLHLDVLPSTTAKVQGVAVEPGDLDVSVQSEALLPIELKRGSTTTTYSFRCLPTDFPRFDIQRPGNPTPGWYLTTFGQGNNPQPGLFNVIFDDRGAPVWYKRSPENLVDLRRVADGTLAASTLGQFFGTGPGAIVEDDLTDWIYDLGGNLLEVWGTDDLAFPVDHHDFVPGPGNGWTIVSYPYRENVDLTAVDGGVADDNVLDGAIRELDASGTTAWSWRSNDHFGPGATTYVQRFGRYTDVNGGELDAVHINSIDRQPNGDYLVSARHMDAVFVVDHATKQVKWVLGSEPLAPADNLDGATQLTIVGDPLGGPRRQHDARLDGDILTVYDNRTGMPGEPSRVAVYQIDAAAGTATLIREIPQPAGQQSGALGSARLAADGSVLVDWGQLQPMFQEFDASNRLMFSIGRVPYGSSYRIVKYPIGDFDAAELRATAGGEIQSPPMGP